MRPATAAATSAAGAAPQQQQIASIDFVTPNVDEDIGAMIASWESHLQQAQAVQPSLPAPPLGAPAASDAAPDSAADAALAAAAFAGALGAPPRADAAAAAGPGRALLAAAAAPTGGAVTGIFFVTAAPGQRPTCPAPPANSTQTLLATNLKRGAAGAASELYACVSTGAKGPFIASLQLTAPGGACPGGTTALPANLNGPVPNAPRVLACVTSTFQAADAVKAVRVALADRGAPARCGFGFAAAQGDANAGTSGGLSAYLCTSSKDQGMIAYAQRPQAGSVDSVQLIHPLAEGLDACLTPATGESGQGLDRRRGMRVVSWPCKGSQPGPFQQWVFVPKGNGRCARGGGGRGPHRGWAQGPPGGWHRHLRRWRQSCPQLGPHFLPAA
jgi:hypothetical protein